ncbi:MAG: hypothetical protein AAGK04_10850 [Planctomycetota bacterium]
MTRRFHCLMAGLAVGLGGALASAEAPTCGGIPATVYVDESGRVVGGILDGSMYMGMLLGTEGDDVIVGTDGDDLIIGYEGDDIICGGEGRDRLWGHAGDDHIDGGRGVDYIHAGFGCDGCEGEEELCCEEPFAPTTPAQVVGGELYTNAGDTRFGRFERADGQVLEVFGTKDAFGLAEQVTQFWLTDQAGDTTRVMLDGAGRPAAFVSEEGAWLSFDWANDPVVLINGVSPNGEVQVTLSYNTETGDVGGRQASFAGPPVAAQPQNLSPRGGVATRFLAAPSNRRAEDVLSTSHSLGPDSGGGGTSSSTSASSLPADQIQVTFERCGSPITDGEVVVKIRRDDGMTASYPATALPGTGVYTASVPTDPEDVTDFGEYCSSVFSTIGISCNYFDNAPPSADVAICAQIAAAIDLSIFGPTGEGVPIFALCEAGMLAGRLYCATLGQSPPGGGPSVADGICAVIEAGINFIAEDDVTVFAEGFAPGVGFVTSSFMTAPGTGPFPDFDLQFSESPSITSFTTSPSDPAPGQSYVARAVVVCLPPNTFVRMTIVGTDGYTDSRTCVLGGGLDVCNLSVPGAAAGVRDTITVEALIDDGPRRTIAIVF